MPIHRKEIQPDGQEDHSQKAYKGIRRMLYHKELVPGQKVSCRDLAGRLNMSLTPVIQALKYMEIQAFVRHEPNRGYFLTLFSLNEVEEIYELRELLEPSLIYRTVEFMNENGRRKLKEALEAHLTATRALYSQERLFKNVQFHLTLASLSDKPTPIRVLRNLFDLLILKYGGNQGSIETMDSSDREHRNIYECVISNDAEGAREILLQHIKTVKKQVIERLKKIQEERENIELWEI